MRSWKGRTFIDIREWYVDKSTMDTKPGKKGISLTPEQYQERCYSMDISYVAKTYL